MKSDSPLVPVGRALDAGQHHVHDVLGQVVITRRDPALGPGDRVDVALDVTRARAGSAHIGAGVGLRQAHGPGVAAVEHRRQEALAVLVEGEVLHQVGGAVREPRIHLERGVGAALQLLQHHADCRGAAEAAALRRDGERHQPHLEELPPRLSEARRRDHTAALHVAAGPIACRVERAGHLGGESIRLVDDRVALRAREMRESFELEQALGAEVVPEREADRPEVGLEVVAGGQGHGRRPATRSRPRSARCACARPPSRDRAAIPLRP